jgi:hypothetical protein
MMTLKEQMQEFREEIESLRATLQEKWRLLHELENSCKHIWNDPRHRTDIIHYDCGQYGGHYDSTWWERECSVCGKIEKTFKEACVKVPDFSDSKGSTEWSDGWTN